MVFFNYSTMQMAAKVVYYGPGLCGKTTNLQHIYSHTSNNSRGEMVSLETETDRTLFFDLLPLDVGKIQGFKTRIQLYTVPGQVFYNTTRKLVLKGVDGVVFVADSQKAMLQANVDSFENLKANLAEIGLSLDELPLVLQYNKRDLSSICSVEEMDAALNADGRWQSYEAAAITGDGVFDTLKGISKLTLLRLKERLQDTSQGAAASARPATAAPAPVPAAEPTVDAVGDDPEDTATTAQAPPAATGDTPDLEAGGRRGGVDILAELEKIRQQARAGKVEEVDETAARDQPTTPASVNGNGHREIAHSFHFRPAAKDLVRTSRVSIRVQIEDADQAVVDSFQEAIRVDDPASLEHLLLRLNIALDPESPSGAGDS